MSDRLGLAGAVAMGPGRADKSRAVGGLAAAGREESRHVGADWGAVGRRQRRAGKTKIGMSPGSPLVRIVDTAGGGLSTGSAWGGSSAGQTGIVARSGRHREVGEGSTGQRGQVEEPRTAPVSRWRGGGMGKRGPGLSLLMNRPGTSTAQAWGGVVGRLLELVGASAVSGHGVSDAMGRDAVSMGATCRGETSRRRGQGAM